MEFIVPSFCIAAFTELTYSGVVEKENIKPYGIRRR